MNRTVLTLALLITTIFTQAQQKPAYVLYTGKGKKASYQKMINSISAKDVVLFGEFHNNPISHWLQLEVTKDCDSNRDLILGAATVQRRQDLEYPDRSIRRHVASGSGAGGVSGVSWTG